MIERFSSGFVAAIIAGLSLGSIPVISALLRDVGISSVEQVFLRLFFGSLVALSFIVVLYLRDLSTLRSSLTLSVQVTYFIQGLFLTLAITVYLAAISLNTPVGEAALLIQVHPFVTLFFGVLLYREKITPPKIYSLVFAFIGLVLLVRPWMWDSFMQNLIGDVLAISNGTLYAIYLLIGTGSSKRRKSISPQLSTSWVLIWAFLTGIVILVCINFLPFPSEISSFAFKNLLSADVLFLGLILALFGSIIPYSLIMTANKYGIESSVQSILVLGEPVSAIMLGAVILQEPILIWYLIGGGALACAIILLNIFNQEKGDKKEN